MRVCDGITYMVIGEAPDLRSVDEEIRHRWNSLSIDTARREPHAKTHRRLLAFQRLRSSRTALLDVKAFGLLTVPVGFPG